MLKLTALNFPLSQSEKCLQHHTTPKETRKEAVLISFSIFYKNLWHRFQVPSHGVRKGFHYEWVESLCGICTCYYLEVLMA